MDARGDEVRKYVEAPPDLVYRLVSDITRLGEWSPETYSCQWIDGSVGPVVGARFKARNRRGRLRWSRGRSHRLFSRMGLPPSACGPWGRWTGVADFLGGNIALLREGSWPVQLVPRAPSGDVLAG